MAVAHIAGGVHDGARLHRDAALLVEDGLVHAISPVRELPPDLPRRDWGAGTICPAFVDLQANGGGGIMFNGRTDADGLAKIAAAHARTGTGWLLPTLITDTPDKSRAAMAAVERVLARGDTPIAGLHLEGPHLAVTRRGAHDASLVRPMDSADLDFLCDAARRLPALIVTLAPERVAPDRIARLAQAGVLVSLGHSDADYGTCRAAFAAGARSVTHLFNAMGPMAHRNPGLVGAALDTARISIGLIGDGHHVHPAAIRIAHAARPGGLFLVTDAMATLGSDIDGFTLNGRQVRCRDGRLTLADGTLAGADVTMGEAIGVMVRDVGLPAETAIAMATGRPGRVLGLPGAGRIVAGTPLTAIYLSETGRVDTIPDA